MTTSLFIYPHNAITEYNQLHELKAQVIAGQGGKLEDKGCWWFKGDILANRTHEEFAEDCTHPVRDLAPSHPNSNSFMHTYNFKHIDHITDHLGIPWEPSKDTPFSSSPIFIGFVWDIENKTVDLPPAKHAKYIAVIRVWLSTTVHTLKQVQKLHGWLSHVSLVIPEGSAYLTLLQYSSSTIPAHHSQLIVTTKVLSMAG